jgi:hypothetical protein
LRASKGSESAESVRFADDVRAKLEEVLASDQALIQELASVDAQISAIDIELARLTERMPK